MFCLHTFCAGGREAGRRGGRLWWWGGGRRAGGSWVFSGLGSRCGLARRIRPSEPRECLVFVSRERGPQRKHTARSSTTSRLAGGRTQTVRQQRQDQCRSANLTDDTLPLRPLVRVSQSVSRARPGEGGKQTIRFWTESRGGHLFAQSLGGMELGERKVRRYCYFSSLQVPSFRDPASLARFMSTGKTEP